jgi:hypothetical protein
MGMRYLDVLKGQVLTYYAYSWNTTYSKVLLRDDLHADTTITAQSGALTDGAAYTDNILNFLQPFKYSSKMVLDGIARGNIKININLAPQTNPSSVNEYVKVTPSLVAITEAGVERTLATGSTSSEVTLAATWAGGVATLTTCIPFFINLNDQTVAEDERLLLRLNVQCKYANLVNTVTRTVTYYTALNSQDVFIEIPVVL